MNKMRKVILLVMLACAQLTNALSSMAVEQKQGFNITCNVQGLKNGENLFVLVKRGSKLDTVSEAKAHNGIFIFYNVKLPVFPEFYLINIQTEFVDDLRLFLDQAGDVKITGNLRNWSNVKVTGSVTHQDYLDCENLRKVLRAKDFYVKYPERSAPVDTVTKYVLKEAMEIIGQRPGSYYMPYWLATLQHPAAEEGYTYSPEMKAPLYDLLSPKVKASYYGEVLAKQITDYAIRKERLGQLKAAAQGLVSISNTETVKQLAANTAVKIEILSTAPSSAILAEARLIEKLEQATVIVNMAFKRGDELLNNPTTAYMIDESGICVTNYHVGKEYSSKTQYQSISIMTKDGKSYPVTKILSASESDDLMVFQVDTRGNKLSALPLGNTATKGAAVHVMGHPGSNFYHFTSGVISGYDAGSFAGQPCNTMSITAYFNVGSSGGPIVDDCGNVVGTVSRITESGERIGIPVSELKKLIEFKK
jgi:hypothetical protein